MLGRGPVTPSGFITLTGAGGGALGSSAHGEAPPRQTRASGHLEALSSNCKDVEAFAMRDLKNAKLDQSRDIRSVHIINSSLRSTIQRNTYIKLS